ncbi:MAG: GNAT family N-acetyltransferase [Bacteroidetes bacterium]|nr:MAG: GNAT family N-acetyltransferase [Bacteroidota bacterium]
MEIRIRKAEASDLPAIHRLVGELAAYEKAPEEFVADLEEYARCFEQGIFQSHVAEVEGRVVGMTVFYLGFSTWKGRMLYLEDFVVSEPYRRLGVGQRLFEAYLATARELGCKVAKWQVLDWNQPAIEFYKKQGAVLETNWWNGKLFFDSNLERYC